MEQVQYCRTLPVFDEVDILVVGAGPAGIGAAISASRSGAKTMLFDQNGYVGGQATAGRVGPFMTCYDAKNENMIIRGIFKEIVERMKVLGGAIDPKEIQAEEPYSGKYGYVAGSRCNTVAAYVLCGCGNGGKKDFRCGRCK